MSNPKVVLVKAMRNEKDVLFGSRNPAITKEIKVKKWKELAQLAESLGIINGKPWTYVRDTVWANWRKRTLAKRVNAKAKGDKEVKYNELDLLVLEILGKDNPYVEEREKKDSFDVSLKTAEREEENEILLLPLCDNLEKDQDNDTNVFVPQAVPCLPKGKRSTGSQYDLTEEKRQKKLDLQIENLQLQNYKYKLEILELENKLGLKRSEFTQDLKENVKN